MIQGLWLLSHHKYWTIIETAFAVAQNCGDFVPLVLQDGLLQVLHQIIHGADVGWTNSWSG